jgi:hypothetical protein
LALVCRDPYTDALPAGRLTPERAGTGMARGRAANRGASMTITVSYSRDIIRPEFRTNSVNVGTATDVVGAGGQLFFAYQQNATTVLEQYPSIQAGPPGLVSFPAQGATNASQPALAELANGNILVVWAEGQAGEQGIRGRLYGANGAPLGNELTLVAGINVYDVSVAPLTGGGFALSYTTGNHAGVAVFDANGAGPSFSGLSPMTTNAQPSIAPLLDGGFVTTYSVDVPGELELHARIHDANGTLRKADFTIDDAGYNGDSAVTALPNGDWAVVWRDLDGADQKVGLRIFSPTGNAVADVRFAAPNAMTPDVTALPNGFIVVSWIQESAVDSVYGRIFDQEGAPILLAGSATPEFLFSTGVNAGNAALAALDPAGTFIASWQEQIDDSSEIHSQVSQLVRHSVGDGADDTFTQLFDALNDVMQGGDGNDKFKGGGGANTLDGGAGIDTSLYPSDLANYDVYMSGGHLIVEGSDFVDTLTGIEFLQFDDGTLAAEDGDPLFDTFYYMKHNPDVFHAGVDAITHYKEFGWREGRDPNELFDTSAYLAANRDVAAAGVNPLEHYRAIGWKEGRDPSAIFDTQRYLIDHPDAVAAGIDPITHFLTVERSLFVKAVGAIQSGFDAQYYLMHNPDVAAAGVDPLAHFKTFGWHEGRDPNGWFDTSAYLAKYADVAAAGVNPLEHYLAFGWKEGRDPSDKFHTADYLAANPDVAAAGVNPLEHFLQFGFYEHRQGVDYGLWQ